MKLLTVCQPESRVKTMCGRFLMNEEALEAVSQIAQLPSYEQLTLHLGMIYPSQESLVLQKGPEGPVGTLLPFGVQPDFLKQRLINARAETVWEKPMFRRAMKNGRCLIPCSGFYEWDSAKNMIYFQQQDHPVLYLAGIDIEEGFVILTTAANASMEPFHHRMPLILSEKQAMEWLYDPQKARELTRIVPPVLEHRFWKKQNSLF